MSGFIQMLEDFNIKIEILEHLYENYILLPTGLLDTVIQTVQ